MRREMMIGQEEIFGPVLAIPPYDTVEEAAEIANDTVYGLGAHVQGTDMEEVREVASRFAPGRFISTRRTGIPMRPSAATSARATAGNTGARAWRSIWRRRPSSASTARTGVRRCFSVIIFVSE
jgi:acyl-CoA reductase-like NAD-dependent aldehyde dehydrogenase